MCPLHGFNSRKSELVIRRPWKPSHKGPQPLAIGDRVLKCCQRVASAVMCLDVCFARSVGEVLELQVLEFMMQALAFLIKREGAGKSFLFPLLDAQFGCDLDVVDNFSQRAVREEKDFQGFDPMSSRKQFHERPNPFEKFFGGFDAGSGTLHAYVGGDFGDRRKQLVRLCGFASCFIVAAVGVLVRGV